MITTSQAADLFRRVGASNPLEAACGQTPSAKPNKYNARKKEIDGHVFDSTAEARRYQHLKALEQCGDIAELELQPRFVLQEAFRDTQGRKHRKIEYVADFSYVRGGLCRVVEDVKGVETPVFKLKYKMFAQRYPNVKLEIVR